MKTYKLIALLLLLVVFINCKKENKINKSLEGTWNLTEYNRSGGSTKTDFSQEKMSFEFSKYKNAYTQTMKGVFVVDFLDPIKVDVRDTFSYELKNEEFVISKVKAGSQYTTLLKNRYKIEEYKENVLKLARIDSAGLYIKATK
ncbi:MAG: hypothetical protein V4608_04295 [Bacteroidota bacterium]